MTAGDRLQLALVCACAVLAALAETAGILLFGRLTDDALTAGSVSAFWGPAGVWLVVAVAGAVVGYLGNSLAVRAAERFVRRLRAKVFAHVQRLPPHVFQRYRQGDLVERLTGDVEAIEQLAVSGVVQGAAAGFGVLFYGVAALWLRWDLAVATFLLVPVFWVAARRFSGRLGSVARRERAADGAITAVVEEALENVVLTQAYHRYRAEERRLDREARAWLHASVTGARLSELYEQLVEVIETVCVLAVIGLGAWEISAGRMTLGQLLSFAGFLGYLYPPVRSLGQLGLTATAATAAAERLLELLDTPPAVTDPPAAPNLPHPAGVTGVPPRRAVGRLDVRGVGFCYPGSARAALSDVTFRARPGELVVVTGPSGAGKSTLAALLPRFYDPTRGTVCLDGRPLSALPLAELRTHITLLPQRTLVLHDTVRENIACGRPGATDAEIVAAAEAADAHGFVRALPQGYDTVVAPHAARLSGGQLQRIAIARAMLRDAPVLVLDEPTTGLDGLAAQRVLGPLRRLVAGRTTLVITHDLTLAPFADQVLVLADGRLAETGTHAGLLAEGGLYARLYAAQHPGPLRPDAPVMGVDHPGGWRTDPQVAPLRKVSS
ncbi:ABC transporter ATP-binding protein [Streptomyces odontomachi]|uniref:ABC transporter ATP-binding protein n=1 Tax=Streptomyces odontomachi TaxID=2944940 RepID=UPI0021094008|nr:ABC transporter ATP-binding protein [Streptomyces sp. ODS25]